jgi:hypothetical protein
MATFAALAIPNVLTVSEVSIHITVFFNDLDATASFSLRLHLPFNDHIVMAHALRH